MQDARDLAQTQPNPDGGIRCPGTGGMGSHITTASRAHLVGHVAESPFGMRIAPRR